LEPQGGQQVACLDAGDFFVEWLRAYYKGRGVRLLIDFYAQ
jgi:hypothetical protein